MTNRLFKNQQTKNEKLKKEYTFYEILGCYVKVNENDKAMCCNEVKRRGYIIDSQQVPFIELRTNDEIVVYLHVGQ